MTIEPTGLLQQFKLATPAQTLRGWTAGSRSHSRRPPVLFVHPINLQGAAWAAVARAISADHFSMMPDLRGHGRSTAKGPFGVDAWVEDLIAVLDHFDVSRCHVVGGSNGGSLAVALADRIPEQVISIGAFGSTLARQSGETQGTLDLLLEAGERDATEQAVPRISVAPGTTDAIISAIVDMTNPHDTATVSEVRRAAIDIEIRCLADAFDVPALVVTGEFDRTCPPDLGRKMAEALNAQFVTMPGIGHLPMLEAPEQTAALLREFFNRSDMS